LSAPRFYQSPEFLTASELQLFLVQTFDPYHKRYGLALARNDDALVSSVFDTGI
jgi:hypothetical protein